MQGQFVWAGNETSSQKGTSLPSVVGMNEFSLNAGAVTLPKVEVATTFEEAEILAHHLLMSQPLIVGLDTETTIGREEIGKPSTLQISTHDRVYIFQLYRIYKETVKILTRPIQVPLSKSVGGFFDQSKESSQQKFPSSLIKFLKNPECVKVGVNLTNDIELLSNYSLKVLGGLDIQYITRSLQIPESGLHDLCVRYIPNFPGKDHLGHEGTWDTSLTTYQVYYAASDAYYSLLLYEAVVGASSKHSLATPPRENADYLQVVEWLKLTIQSSINSRTVESLINQLVNSYGPWAKTLTRAQKLDQANKYFQMFIQSHEGKECGWDDLTKTFKVCQKEEPPVMLTMSERELMGLYNSFLKTECAGMKYASIVNKIANSYAPFTKFSIKQREQIAKIGLDTLIQRGHIYFANDRLMIR